MFSLIITIISIALVTALALATIYYGGSAFKKGQAEAAAAKVVLQSQQLLGAAEVFHAALNRWPDNIGEMVTLNYLKSIPVAAAGSGVAYMGEALAAGAAQWTMPAAGEPTFVLAFAGQDSACQSVNLKSFGQTGIRRLAYTSYATQCFGDSSTGLTIVASKTPQNIGLALPVGKVVEGQPSAATTGPEWFSEPGAVAVAVVSTGGTGTSGGPAPLVEPSFGPFTLAQHRYGDPAFVLDAPSSTSSGAFAFASDNTAVVTVAGNVATLQGPGSATITVTQAPAGQFKGMAATATLTVLSPEPVLPPGFVSIGGLTWSLPGDSLRNYSQAVNYCATSINGTPGWRLPTQAELAALYNQRSAAGYLGQGWPMYNGYNGNIGVYRASDYVDADHHAAFSLTGYGPYNQPDSNAYYEAFVVCVKG